MMVGVFWSLTAYAAQISFANDLREIPPVAVAIALLLAVIGGLAHTGQILAQVDYEVKSVPLAIFKDMSLSITAGLITFFVVGWLSWPSLLQAAAITIAGYSASRIMDAYVNRLIDVVNSKTPRGPVPPPDVSP